MPNCFTTPARSTSHRSRKFRVKVLRELKFYILKAHKIKILLFYKLLFAFLHKLSKWVFNKWKISDSTFQPTSKNFIKLCVGGMGLESFCGILACHTLNERVTKNIKNRLKSSMDAALAKGLDGHHLVISSNGSRKQQHKIMIYTYKCLQIFFLIIFTKDFFMKSN